MPPGSSEPHDDEPDGGDPHGAGPTGGRKALRIFGKTVKYGLIVLLVLIVGGAAAGGVYYWQADIPQPGSISAPQTATIVANDGTTVLAEMGANRKDVDLDQIPPHVRNAVIAAEDRNFYSNPGFSVSGYLRAARDNVLGRDNAGGGSTITQQYVKNALVGSDRSLWRKMKELVVSAKMTRNWSKDQILEAYLNTIYFGRGAYGVEAASEAYFGVPVEQLDVAQGAVLAEVIRSPSVLDPSVNPDMAEGRWNYVLDGMVETGALDPAKRASMTFPTVLEPGESQGQEDRLAGPNGLIKTQVIQELKNAGISEQEINTGGLKITTTIDPKVQNSVVDAAKSKLEGEPDTLRTAAVSVDPRTGAVRGYYGGPSGTGYDFANAPLQTGSTFKVFGLAALLDEGRSLATTFDSSPLTVNGIDIGNVGGESCGSCTIAQALKMSLNTSFYRMELSLDHGSKSVADMAHKAGIPKQIPGVEGTSLQNDDGNVSNGIILGEYLSRPLDMASAFGTFAASGVHHDPFFVSKVVTSDGNVLLDHEPGDGERAMSEAVADNVTAAMEPIAAYSRGHSLAGGRDSAAKTGTTQLGDSGANKDAWMIGFTPSLSTAVWVGDITSGKPLTNYAGNTIYGSGLPSDIWKSAMDGALKGTDYESFPDPPAIGGVAGVPQWTRESPTATTGAAPTTTGPAPTTAPGDDRQPQLQLPQITQTEIMGVPVPVIVPPNRGGNEQGPGGGAGGGAGQSPPAGGGGGDGNGNGNGDGGQPSGGGDSGPTGDGGTGGNAGGPGGEGGGADADTDYGALPAGVGGA
ncbi:transglycosylase domain-containing protein [Tomitella fengzijianii]|uniref:Penicillin-binding protein n=1 Tax=Tomitella fengzijianii TaxID=2597660 RepID=A0A516X6Z1_9ACTN|nr:transglycosylase domain-containing protein [Tomitella fengzijianii]QDQ98838.1 penicillin-binding protein [Tomitella fengzijianii]